MAKLTAQERKRLPKKAFAVPEKAPKAGSYPIPDTAHARNALARVSQHGTPEERRQVRAAVARKFAGITQSAAQRRSTRGSPPFGSAEFSQGFRSLGKVDLGVGTPMKRPTVP